jgi:hypothetical protein
MTMTARRSPPTTTGRMRSGPYVPVATVLVSGCRGRISSGPNGVPETATHG